MSGILETIQKMEQLIFNVPTTDTLTYQEYLNNLNTSMVQLENCFSLFQHQVHQKKLSEEEIQSLFEFFLRMFLMIHKEQNILNYKVYEAILRIDLILNQNRKYQRYIEVMEQKE